MPDSIWVTYALVECIVLAYHVGRHLDRLVVVVLADILAWRMSKVERECET